MKKKSEERGQIQKQRGMETAAGPRWARRGDCAACVLYHCEIWGQIRGPKELGEYAGCAQAELDGLSVAARREHNLRIGRQLERHNHSGRLPVHD